MRQHYRKGRSTLRRSYEQSQKICSKVAGLDLTRRKILSGVGAQLLILAASFCSQAGVCLRLGEWDSPKKNKIPGGRRSRGSLLP